MKTFITGQDGSYLVEILLEKGDEVHDIVRSVFAYVGIHNQENYIEIDPRYYRPIETDVLVADTSKTKEKLRGRPKKIDFWVLVRDIMDADLQIYGIKK